MRLFRSRPALSPLDEASAYARCHGERSDEIVRIAPLPQPPDHEPAPVAAPEPRHASPRGLTGESLRKAFESRLRSR